MYRFFCLTASWFIYVSALNSCTAGASSDQPCQRSCSNRPVGGGKLAGKAYTPSLTIECASGQTMPQQTLYFLIYEENKASGDGANIQEKIPKAGIAFTPMLPSGVTLDSPQSDWCTDSCGIAEIKFTPVCGWTINGAIMPIVPGMLSDEFPQTSYTQNIPGS